MRSKRDANVTEASAAARQGALITNLIDQEKREEKEEKEAYYFHFLKLFIKWVVVWTEKCWSNENVLYIGRVRSSLIFVSNMNRTHFLPRYLEQCDEEMHAKAKAVVKE